LLRALEASVKVRTFPHISARHERRDVSYFTGIFDRLEVDQGAANASKSSACPFRKASRAAVSGPWAGIHRKGTAGEPKSQSTFHCRGADRSRQPVGARASAALLGPAPASVLSVARWNGPGI